MIQVATLRRREKLSDNVRLHYGAEFYRDAIVSNNLGNHERDYGAVFSTTISSYIYVTVKRHSPLFNEPIRINYSRSALGS